MGTKVVWVIGSIPIVKVTTVSGSSFQVTNILVAGSMVGLFNVHTTFSVLSVGMTMLSSLCCHGYDRYQL